MGRFENLEFEEPQRQDELQPGWAPRDEQYYLTLAHEQFQSGEFKVALRYYSRALEFNAHGLDGWFGQVRMLIELGDYREAGVWVDKALELFHDHPDLLAAKAVALARAGNTDKALQLSDAAVQQPGNTPYVWLARGEVLLALRQANDEYCFSKAQASAGTRDWFLLLTIARVYYFYRQAAKALTYLQQALMLRQTSPYLWCIQGDCQLAVGLAAGAVHSYEQALTFDRRCAHAAGALARLRDRGILSRIAAGVKGFLARLGAPPSWRPPASS